MPHTHIHLHEDDEAPFTAPPEKGAPALGRKPPPEPQAKPAQPPKPPAASPPKMSPAAAKVAARRIGRTMKALGPDQGIQEVRKMFGDEVAERFAQIAETLGLDDAIADLDDHIVGMAEEKPTFGQPQRRPPPQGGNGIAPRPGLGRDRRMRRGRDEWSPEAREAAAEARRQKGHLHMTATPGSGSKPAFRAQASNLGEVNNHLNNLHAHLKRTNGEPHHVSIENKNTGEVHSAHVAPHGIYNKTF